MLWWVLVSISIRLFVLINPRPSLMYDSPPHTMLSMIYIYIYIYIFLNIIVSLIELFGFKLFSLVLNKSFSFPFEPFGNAFGLNADINPLQNNSCLPAIFVVWPCYESYLNLMLNWIKLLISNNLSLSHLQRISHDLVNKIFTYLSIYIYI